MIFTQTLSWYCARGLWKAGQSFVNHEQLAFAVHHGGQRFGLVVHPQPNPSTKMLLLLFRTGVVVAVDVFSPWPFVHCSRSGPGNRNESKGRYGHVAHALSGSCHAHQPGDLVSCLVPENDVLGKMDDANPQTNMTNRDCRLFLPRPGRDPGL